MTASSAEVLQVRSSNLLQIGDQNRSYTVKLSCLNIYSDKDEEAKILLKNKLPRRTKVNLRPDSSENGILLARVTVIGEDKDVNKIIAENGLGKFTCAEYLDN